MELVELRQANLFVHLYHFSCTFSGKQFNICQLIPQKTAEERYMACSKSEIENLCMYKIEHILFKMNCYQIHVDKAMLQSTKRPIIVYCNSNPTVKGA